MSEATDAQKAAVFLAACLAVMFPREWAQYETENRDGR